MTNSKIPERKDIPNSDKWDLTLLFDSEESWKALFEKVQDDLEGYDRYKGKLSDSASVLAEAIEFDLSLGRKLDKLYTYAHLNSDQDKSVSHSLGMLQQVVSLYTRAGEQSSYMTPEIQEISDQIMAEFMEDASLEEYRFYLKKILRLKPHTLDSDGEKLMAMTGEIAQASSQIFGQLDNVDLSFGVIEDEKGHKTELSHGNFITFLMNPNREVRKNAFFQYYDSYKQHKHTLAATLSHSVKKDLFYSRARNHDSCLKAALYADNVPEAVYDNLIASVRNNLYPLFEYLNFRRNTLGLDQLHMFDTYVPLVSEIKFHMTYEDAVETAGKALAPLGDDYVSILTRGLEKGWVDRYENKGKRSGAYSSGCYDSPPYILLNYEDQNINSLYTLVHEAGHSMHSYLSNRRQPYVYHNYTIFVAEVASTFNEVLLSHFLLEFYKDDPKMTDYILNREIDNIRATLFRQTMFAEFEKNIHLLAEKNEPLTVDVFTEQYRKLLEVYFGDSLSIDPELHLECMRIPHFYSAFYVYKYATGISAAITLARRVLSGDHHARDVYLNFLGMGGSMFPLDELKEAGVDLKSPEPIEDAVEYFRQLKQRLVNMNE
jgi:oligoendopeptidase F